MSCRPTMTILMAALVARVALGAGPATASVEADRCGGTKTKAVAKYAKTLFQCHSSALRRGEDVDPACLAKGQLRLAAGFDKVEAVGGCVTIEDEAAIQVVVDAALAEVEALLSPDPDEEALRCASSKLKASGGHLQKSLNCYGSKGRRSLGPKETCLERAFAKLVSRFARAETRGGCTTTADHDAVSQIDDEATEEVVRALSPVCGDAIQGPTQECDIGDPATCPGLCTSECVCDLPAVCGDGVAKLPEHCDDGNLDDGDGCSAACELEDASALCTGVDSSSGTDLDAVFMTNEFAAPTFLTGAPLDPTRLFVTERTGYVRILHLLDRSADPVPFLDISDLTTTGGEQGLLSMAFDPDYPTNGRFFVSHTNTSGDLVVARYEVDAGNPNVADESTRQDVLVVDHPGTSHHNGGQIQFGGDGYLYWSIGDGGSGLNSQDLSSMLGKILRLDVDRDTAPFAVVPPTNPYYVDGSSDLEYIWARGLRNPWRFSFDRGTGDLYLGDVGAGSVEEIDYAPSTSTGGENYGWNTFEGSTCHRPPCPDPPTAFSHPVHEYSHGGPCAVMGGYVYRGCAMPDFAGTYFFSDYCAAFVRTFEVVAGVATGVVDRTTDAKSAGASFTGVTSWGEDARGELYLINGNNRIFRIEPQ